jgi:GTP cyclohydrolase FolE2
MSSAPPRRDVSLSRVGVTGAGKVIRIRSSGTEQLFYAELECFFDPGPDLTEDASAPSR